MFPFFLLLPLIPHTRPPALSPRSSSHTVPHTSPSPHAQSLVEYFGTLSKEWALECLMELLVVNPQVQGGGGG